MTDIVQTSRLSRRALLKIGGGGLVAVAGAGTLTSALRSPGSAQAAGTPVTNPTIDRIFALAGTDGWVSLRGDELTEGNQVVFPDPLGEDRNMYNYGFRDASRWQRILQTVDPNSAAGREAHDAIYAWKGETQNASPLLWVNEGEKVQVVLYNLGWQVRPDIPDGHTIHWHGFRNAIPWFDGVPEMAAGAPIGKTLTYFYNPVDPGTYMYHCHWEDVEHIQMGMTGIVFVNPKQNSAGFSGAPVSFYTAKPGEKYVFNDGNGASAYDRQFAFMLMDFNPLQHWQLAHIQQPDWSDYKPSAWAMNGRSYPDTLLPAGVTELGLEGGVALGPLTATAGSSRVINRTGLPSANTLTGKIVTLISGPGAGQRREIVSNTTSTITVHEPWDAYLGLPANGTVFRVHNVANPELRSQPQSSLVTCEPGDRVLLRVANLGYQQHAMLLEGIEMLVVGRDSTFLADRLYRTSQIDVAPGEAYDVIFTAPEHSGGSEADVYMFYDRNLHNDGTAGSFGGMATEVHVHPAASGLRGQAVPNDTGL
jgi:FtsP/CotA-like multicopper oxidase with cupredoxin domain